MASILIYDQLRKTVLLDDVNDLRLHFCDKKLRGYILNVEPPKDFCPSLLIAEDSMFLIRT